LGFGGAFGDENGCVRAGVLTRPSAGLCGPRKNLCYARSMNDVPFWRLEALSDRQLLDGLGAVLGSGRRLVAELVAHLGEVEERRLHLEAACSSMFSYCVHRLGLSERRGLPAHRGGAPGAPVPGHVSAAGGGEAFALGGGVVEASLVGGKAARPGGPARLVGCELNAATWAVPPSRAKRGRMGRHPRHPELILTGARRVSADAACVDV